MNAKSHPGFNFLKLTLSSNADAKYYKHIDIQVAESKRGCHERDL